MFPPRRRYFTTFYSFLFLISSICFADLTKSIPAIESESSNIGENLNQKQEVQAIWICHDLDIKTQQGKDECNKRMDEKEAQAKAQIINQNTNDRPVRQQNLLGSNQNIQNSNIQPKTQPTTTVQSQPPIQNQVNPINPKIISSQNPLTSQTSPEIPTSDQITGIDKGVNQIQRQMAMEDSINLDGNFMDQSSMNMEMENNNAEEEEGYRALLVFGIASVLAAIYFYVKLKKIKDRERHHYGILDDREFELRHLSMSSDEEVGFTMRDAFEVNTPRTNKKKGTRVTMNNTLMSSGDESEEDVMTYTSQNRKPRKQKQFKEYV